MPSFKQTSAPTRLRNELFSSIVKSLKKSSDIAIPAELYEHGMQPDGTAICRSNDQWASILQ